MTIFLTCLCVYLYFVGVLLTEALTDDASFALVWPVTPFIRIFFIIENKFQEYCRRQ
jgi:hypothetical protein